MLTNERVMELRTQFPALSRQSGGRTAVFLDGPAGTQVPQSVIDAISFYLSTCNANSHGVFDTSVESDRHLDACHQAAADFLGADDKDCVAFGQNMTTMTLALARALGRKWQGGDNIVLSGLEHDANYTPWTQAAHDAHVEVRVAGIRTEDCTLDLDDLYSKIDDRTRLVAVGCASNAAGTVNPVREICERARAAGATTFLDAVHYAPHDLIDVEAFGCDFLACSAYKFFGPHIGILWGRRELLESIQPYKLRPSPNDLPGRWMTGTQNHECILGVKAAIDYIAEIGESEGKSNRRERLKSAFEQIREYERSLCDRLLDGLMENENLKIWGITNPEDRDARLPTVSITHKELTSGAIAKRLNVFGIYAWNGNYYALPLTERIGTEPDGMVRLGLAHYNTMEEVDYCLRALSEI